MKIHSGLAPRDGNLNSLDVAAKFVTQDGTTSPQSSPLSKTTTQVVKLVTPANATKVTIYASKAVKVYTAGAYDTVYSVWVPSGGYTIIGETKTVTFPCDDLSDGLYLTDLSGESFDVYFHYETLS